MKTKSSLWTTAAFAAVMISPALALEAPADDSPPPSAVENEPANLPEFKLPPAAPHPATQTSAFLGVVSGQVPGCLADHINLKPGEGVIVRSLVPEGPAAKAGLAVNDVIVAVGGQSVGSPEDISARVGAHKPGELITLDLIHKGQPSKVEVSLCVRPEGYAFAEPGLDLMHLDNLPKELADRIKADIAGKVGGMDLNAGEDGDALPPQIEEAMRQLQRRMRGAIDQGGFKLPEDNPAGAAKVETKSSATFRMKDNDGSVEVKSIDGSKEVTIRDRQDKVIWNGPWDTDQDKAAAPAEVRTRMQGLNLDSTFKGQGLRFQMNPQMPPAGDDH